MKRKTKLEIIIFFYKKKAETSKDLLGGAPMDFLYVDILPSQRGFVLSFEGKKSKIFAKNEEDFQKIRSILAKKCIFKNSFMESFKMIRRIQKGGFGDVWLISRKFDSKFFAVKIVSKTFGDSAIKVFK